MNGFVRAYFAVLAALATNRAARFQGVAGKWTARAERWGAKAKGTLA